MLVFQLDANWLQYKHENHLEWIDLCTTMELLVIENRFAIILISFVKNEFQINEWLYLLLSTNNLLTHSETPVTNVQSSKTATKKNVYPLLCIKK